MLHIKLHNKPVGNYSNYAEAITQLASNTVISYNGQEIRSRGPFFPTYDISQVCCWISEQSLGNGRRLCSLNNGSNRIVLIEEPVNEERGEMPVNEDNTPLIPDNLLLISDDCYEGLKKSLNYFALFDPENLGEKQELITDPAHPDQFAQNPWNYQNYIWPTKRYNENGEDPTGTITSQDCFVYTKKMALVQYLVTRKIEGEEDDDIITDEVNEAPVEVKSSNFKEFLFVEVNQFLPQPLFVRAQNTIRLFRLNSRYYDHFRGLPFHCIEYNTSNIENEYDDLRLAGRMQTYKRARKSLQQLKTMQTLMADIETMQLFISQYKILMELSGYTSVWAMVFREGDDPGGFNDILGVPAPTAPVVPDMGGGTPGIKRKKEDLLNVNNNVQMNDKFQEDTNRFKKQRIAGDDEILDINIDQFNENLHTVLTNENLWVPMEKPLRGKIPRTAKKKSDVVDNLVKDVFSCSNEVLLDFKQYYIQENTFFNIPLF